MKTKKALIIGVTGQDGSYLAELLIKKKYKVHAILRKIPLNKNKNRFWRINEFKKKIIFHNASLNEYKKLSNLIISSSTGTFNLLLCSDASTIILLILF